MPIRLKIQINTGEIEAFDAPAASPPEVRNPGFSGELVVPISSREEKLATRLRALLQRDERRDLYDVARALEDFSGVGNRFAGTSVVFALGRGGETRGRMLRTDLAPCCL